MQQGDEFNLERFVTAQAPVYATALAELQAGRKRSHWMWFVFPQLRQLGRSTTAQFYGIGSVDEARAYLAHPLLGPRLEQCTRAVLDSGGSALGAIFGTPDDMKFCSSMSLFAFAAPKGANVFREALDRWCGGRMDERTLALLQEVERWREALADFGFPFRIVSHDGAMEAFEAERALGAAEGVTPVFIVPGLWSSAAIAASRRIAKAQRQLGDIGAEAGRAFLATRFARLAQNREAEPESIDPALFDALDPVPAPPPHTGLFLLERYDPTRRALAPVPEVAIMRIPTAHSHTIPLYLDWGGWNAVPAPAEIAAVALHWEQAYGARLVAIGSDRLEFAVSRKPAGHAEAIALLKEQFVFAPDNWEEDRSMLEDAAAQLQTADNWVFWWD